MSDIYPHLLQDPASGDACAGVRDPAARVPSAAWCAANRRQLAAELRDLVRRLARHGGVDPGAADDAGIADAEGAGIEDELSVARATRSQPSALDLLQTRFGLTGFERELVLLCAAYALDGALTERHGPATFALARVIIGASDESWEALAPDRPLQRYRLIETPPSGGLWSGPLRIDDRVLAHLLGIPATDARLDGVLQRLSPPPVLAASHGRIAGAIVDAWQRDCGSWPVIELWGATAEVRRAIAATACQRLGRSVYRLRLHAVRRELDEFEWVRLASREARLEAAVLFIDAEPSDPVEPDAHARTRRLAEDIEAPLVLASRVRGRRLERPAIAIEVPRLQTSEQRALFHERLATEDPAMSPGTAHAVERVVGQFDLGAAAIWEACAIARHNQAAAASDGAAQPVVVVGPHVAPQSVTGSALDPAAQAAADGVAQPATGSALDGSVRPVSDDPAPPPADAAGLGEALWDACRAVSRTHLDGLAQRSAARVGWSDLVIGERQHRALREIVVRVQQRARVYDTWGFGARAARGLGIAALFSGSSGTGKTLAAEVLANELRLDLYRIDLSQVVSKYIGETERNLARVFDAAETGAAVLLFDEADAVFGKRSEVRDSHDRYANLEVGYLLQRVEAYRGVAILTTNMSSALDQAFLRRLAFVVEFPWPDPAQRSAIWRAVLPAQMPSIGLDFDQLGRLPMSGGSIRNVALAAAYLAAEAGVAVSMCHIAAAARDEYLKLDRTAPIELSRFP